MVEGFQNILSPLQLNKYGFLCICGECINLCIFRALNQDSGSRERFYTNDSLCIVFNTQVTIKACESLVLGQLNIEIDFHPFCIGTEGTKSSHLFSVDDVQFILLNCILSQIVFLFICVKEVHIMESRLHPPVRGVIVPMLHLQLRTFDPAFCAHFWTDLLFPKFCIIFHFFW